MSVPICFHFLEHEMQLDGKVLLGVSPIVQSLGRLAGVLGVGEVTILMVVGVVVIHGVVVEMLGEVVGSRLFL